MSTAKEADFVALEPWIGLSTCSDEGDKFEEKTKYPVCTGRGSERIRISHQYIIENKKQQYRIILVEKPH